MHDHKTTKAEEAKEEKAEAKAAAKEEKAAAKTAEEKKAEVEAKEHKKGAAVKVGGKLGKVHKVVGHDPENSPGGPQATYAVVHEDGSVSYALESQVEAVEK